MIDVKDFRETQLLEYELLKKIKEICNKEGLSYYLLGGSIIGAVRHQGFIPWDDDIDVGMMRSDYEKFKSLANKYLDSNQVVLHYELDDSYKDYSMKLVNKKAYFIMKTENSEIKQYVWIDIFPIDGTPDSAFIKWVHYHRIYLYRMMMAYYYLDSIQVNSNRANWKKVLISIARKLPINKLVNPNRVLKKLDKSLKAFPPEKSNIVGNYIGAYKEKEFVPLSYFGEGMAMKFEGEEFVVPKESDKYLTQIYGDYMQLPPIEKQVPKHNVIDVVYEK